MQKHCKASSRLACVTGLGEADGLTKTRADSVTNLTDSLLPICFPNINIDRAAAQGLVERGRRAKWWRRLGSMKGGFRYTTYDGRPINAAGLERIESLVIPPAWKLVRISPAPTGKLQAVGVDTSGRLQYIYNPKFAESRQRQKFTKIEKFGEYLPQLRRKTNEHITLEGFPREKVLAIMTRLINSLYIRLGSDDSVRRYRTYGITTLGNRHVRFGRNGTVIFEFVGKSKVSQRKLLVDTELAALLKELVNIGRGRKLFQYIDDVTQRPRAVTPMQMNAYIKSLTAPEFSSKDFRTWGASLLAAMEFAEIGPAEDERQAKKNIVHVVKVVAEQLGNTPTVCRASYIHPNIIRAYCQGITIDEFVPRRRRNLHCIEAELEPAEVSLLKLFEEFK